MPSRTNMQALCFDAVMGQPCDLASILPFGFGEFGMRFGMVLPVAVGLATAVPAEAARTITFFGTGTITYSFRGPAVGTTGPVSGVITLSDGSNPFGDAITPDDFTGDVFFRRVRNDEGAGFNRFRFSTPSGSGSSRGDFVSGSAFFLKGQLRRVNLSSEFDPDANFLSGNQFGFARFGYGWARSGGYWRMDPSLITPVPEPSTWAMLLFGFGAIGGAMRTAKRRQVAIICSA